MAVPVAMPHMKLSRTHHRNGLFRTASRMPNVSGRTSVQPPVVGGASVTVAAFSSDMAGDFVSADNLTQVDRRGLQTTTTFS
mmetsp:Transcript_25556/g.55874  ORF Transcript_25556/g.55874 Transcript_25556/m.55874 type:complete len:82 (-) Transcript_25556:178-423(-)